MPEAELRRRGRRGRRLPARARRRAAGAPASRPSGSSSIRASASARRPSAKLRAARARSASCSRSACRCLPAGRARRRWPASPASPRRRRRTLAGATRGARRGQRRRGAAGGPGRGAHRSRPRRGRDRRRAGRLAGRRGPASIIHAERQRERPSITPMSRTYFGTDGIRGTVGTAPITPDFMLRLGHAVGQVLRTNDRRADRADRQGHAHLRLHDRVGARGGLRLGRRRRAADRPAADARASPISRGRCASASASSSAPRTTRSRTTASSSSRRAARSSPTPGSIEVEAALRGRAALGRLGRRSARRAGSTTRAAATSSSARAPSATSSRSRACSIVVDAAHGAAYHVAPDVFHELGAEVTAIGCRPDGFNINAGFGATAPAGAGRRRARAAAPTTASRSTATPTGCSSSTPRGRLFNGDELLFVMATDRLQQGQKLAGRRRHADDQPGRRAGAARARGSSSSAPRSATATCSRSWSRAAGSSAARARAICSRSTSTRPATASSAPCWCCRRRCVPADRWPSCWPACTCTRRRSSTCA